MSDTLYQYMRDHLDTQGDTLKLISQSGNLSSKYMIIYWTADVLFLFNSQLLYLE